MSPEQPQQELSQDQLDERQCGERVDYWLTKLGCTLHGQAILENGSVVVRVGVVKIPAEIRRQMKAAKKNGTTDQVAENTPAQG